jgi:N4-gp56 family major capsid protein
MGYTPASNTTNTASLAHLATVYYKTRALDQLKQMFMFLEGTEPDEMPLRSGRTVQWFRYTLFAANSTPSAEGTVGAGLPLTSTTISGEVSEYSDFITLSKLLQATAIDNIKGNAAEQLGYRGGLSVDTITRIEFDANASSVQVATLGAALGAVDIRRATTTLQASNVRPKTSDGSYIGIIHPYALFDLKSDNTAGGFIDVMKYADPAGLKGPSMNGEVGSIESTRLLRSTNVGTTGTAPTLKYYTYVIGKGAVGAVDLAGLGPAKVIDPDRQMFNVNVIDGRPQIADPTGTIGAAVSYWFAFLAKTLDTVTFRYKIILSNSSII